MKRKYLDATEDEIDIIDQAGAENILRIVRKYDDVAIHVIEEQARAKKELKELRHCLRFWEAGVTKVVPLLITVSVISGGFGWYFSEWILQTILSTSMPSRFWTSAMCVIITTCMINTFDTGRLLIWCKNYTYENKQEGEENIIDLLGEPCFDEEVGKWVVAGELVRQLGINCSPIEFGRQLTKLGYKKKHTSIGNAYLIHKKEQ